MRLATGPVRDPQYIIIDELVGVWAALALTGTENLTPLWGAVLFRLLDKWKPGPIGLLDRRGGRWSVMGDDLAAGLVAGILLRLAANVA